jgi:putative mRNA 3-end processing factor
MSLVVFTELGFYCPQADVYIDPLRKVPKAIVTHAHSDHARPGMGQYLCESSGVEIMKLRLGKGISVQGLAYGETIFMNGVEISLFPAGHVPGSAQVKLSYRGEVWVISGDYKTIADGLTPAFESVQCHHFVTESTFGLPIFHWRPQDEVFQDINAWWQRNVANGFTSIMLGYSLGKAQRIMKYLDRGIGDVICHSAIADANLALENSGFTFGTWTEAGKALVDFSADSLSRSLLICPPNAINGHLMQHIGKHAVANCSGWMAVRKSRNWGGVDQGFVLSDHADWSQLLEAVTASRAEHVYVTHGFTDVFARYLRENVTNHAEVVKVDNWKRAEE